jgi:DNA polymerase III subunit epsilon
MTTSAYVPMSARDLVFVDLETSGLDPERHDILELAAVRTTPELQVVERGRVHRFVKMRRPHHADKKALEVNHYNEKEWETYGVDIKVALVEFESLMQRGEPPLVVAMNPMFDMGFLTRAYKDANYPMPEPRYVIDVGSMAWPLVRKGFIDRIALDVLCSRYKIEVPGRAHSAMVDVLRLGRVYAALMGIEFKG